jgi:hypothetical protein
MMRMIKVLYFDFIVDLLLEIFKFREDMNKVLDCRGVVYLDIVENCCQILLVV